MTQANLEAGDRKPSPCPGPFPISYEDRARCRACGECAAIGRLLGELAAIDPPDLRAGAGV